jgi:hypothetical protein
MTRTVLRSYGWQGKPSQLHYGDFLVAPAQFDVPLVTQPPSHSIFLSSLHVVLRSTFIGSFGMEQTESITHSSGGLELPPDLRLLHYNDGELPCQDVPLVLMANESTTWRRDLRIQLAA